MKGDDIAERLLKFAKRVLRVCREFPNDFAGKHVVRQLIRCSSGGGANDEEARGRESLADFIHKMAVARKEIRESQGLSFRLPLVRAGSKTSGPFRVSCFARSAYSLFKAAVVASCSIECSAESMQARFASLPDALWKRTPPKRIERSVSMNSECQDAETRDGERFGGFRTGSKAPPAGGRTAPGDPTDRARSEPADRTPGGRRGPRSGRAPGCSRCVASSSARRSRSSPAGSAR